MTRNRWLILVSALVLFLAHPLSNNGSKHHSDSVNEVDATRVFAPQVSRSHIRILKEEDVDPTTTTTTSTTIPTITKPKVKVTAVAGKNVPKVQATTGNCSKPSLCPQLRQCENSGSYGAGTSYPTYFGAYQFNRSTWSSNGGNPNTYGSASPGEQDRIADLTYARRGRSPWPRCGRYLQ